MGKKLTDGEINELAEKKGIELSEDALDSVAGGVYTGTGEYAWELLPTAVQIQLNALSVERLIVTGTCIMGPEDIK